MRSLVRVAIVVAVLAVGAAWTSQAAAHPPGGPPAHHHYGHPGRLPPPGWYHTPYGRSWSGYYGYHHGGHYHHRPGIHIDLYLAPRGGYGFGWGCYR